MAVSVSWDDEGRTIIYMLFEGNWTWEEFHPVFAENLKMLDSVDHKVCFIVDMLKAKTLPSGALTKVKQVADVNHPNGGLTVYVGANPLLRALGQAFLKIYPKSAQVYPFDFAATIEEARDKIGKWQAANK
jgi:hypothetical protein